MKKINNNFNISKTKEQKLANIIRILMENEYYLRNLSQYNEQEARNGLKSLAERILEEVD